MFSQRLDDWLSNFVKLNLTNFLFAGADSDPSKWFWKLVLRGLSLRVPNDLDLVFIRRNRFPDRDAISWEH